MRQFSLTHTLVGLTIVTIGTIGLGQGWLGQFGTLLFLGIIALGTLWAMIPGGLNLVAFYVLAMPSSVLAYVLFLPVKKRGDKSYYKGSPVLAYWMRDDRIVLVMHYFVDTMMNTIQGQSLFRGRRKLARIQEILDSTNVPEHPVVEAQLKNSVEIWNQDHELRRKIEQRRKIGSGPSEAVIVLDDDSEESVDRVYETINFLWGSEKYQDMRQEIIQLAIWNSLAVDVCYGEKRGFWKEFV